MISIFLKRIFSTKWQIPCIGTGLFLCGIKSGCLFGAIFTNPGPGGTNAMVEPKLQWQSVSSRLSFLLHSASYFLILITYSSKMSARCFLVDMLQLNMIFWCACCFYVLCLTLWAEYDISSQDFSVSRLFHFFESIGISLNKFSVEKKSQYRSRKILV